MISQKQLTIYEILEEMEKLKRTIYSLETVLQRRINPLKGITYKDIKPSVSFGGDTMLNNLIKVEETSNELESKIATYNDYRKTAIEKICEMQKEKTSEEMIVFYRDVLHWKWQDISRIVNYSVRHVHRLYNLAKK